MKRLTQNMNLEMAKALYEREGIALPCGNGEIETVVFEDGENICS